MVRIKGPTQVLRLACSGKEGKKSSVVVIVDVARRYLLVLET